MQSKNYIKILPLLFILTGCVETGNEKDKEITRSEFEEKALSLKNNYQDYSNIIETFKSEKVEAKGNKAKEELNLAYSYMNQSGENKEYKEGYEVSHDIAPSYIYTTLGYSYNVDTSNPDSKFYFSNDKLSCKFILKGEREEIKATQEMEFYFNSDGLEEVFNLKLTYTYEDNSTLYTYFKTTYTWEK